MNAVLSNGPKRIQVWCVALILGCALLACSSPTTDAVPNGDSGKDSTKLTTQASVSLSYAYVSDAFYFGSNNWPEIVLPNGDIVGLGTVKYPLIPTEPIVFGRGLNSTSLVSESFTFRTDPNHWGTAVLKSYKPGTNPILPCVYQIDAEIRMPSGSGVMQFDFSDPKNITYAVTAQDVKMSGRVRARSNCNGTISEFNTRLTWHPGPWMNTYNYPPLSIDLVSGNLRSFYVYPGPSQFRIRSL